MRQLTIMYAYIATAMDSVILYLLQQQLRYKHCITIIRFNRENATMYCDTEAAFMSLILLLLETTSLNF